MIKVQDIVYARFQLPDLTKAEAYLKQFGLIPAHTSGEALYMRGLGKNPVCYIAHKGEPKFIGVGLKAASAQDLQTLAKEEDVKVLPREETGGGQCVRLTDPNGFQVEVVHGMEENAAQPAEAPLPFNAASAKTRLNQPVRYEKRPSHVKRLGHCVLEVKDYPESLAWYQSKLGLIISDQVYIGQEDMPAGAFLRCDCGAKPVDHHTLFLLGAPDGVAQFNHAAFEVENLDDLMLGHDTLREAGAKHFWGIGRHILGSQIFDYWRDPWGFTLEHWTDGDLFDNSRPPHNESIATLLGTVWGPPMPME